jgi:hypothetical protein
MKKTLRELQYEIDLRKEKYGKDCGDYKFCEHCRESDIDAPCAEAYRRMMSKNTNLRRWF